MIVALLHLALGFGQVPSDVQVPTAIRAADVPASVQMSETHFLAESYVNERQWLVFSNRARGLVRVRGLGPFERTLLPIEEGGADGMSVELIAVGERGHMISSGEFRCEALNGATVFLERGNVTINGWLVGHQGKSLKRTDGKPAPHASALRLATPALAAPAHVPVPLPGENRKRSKGKRVKKRKLPPF